MTARAKQLIAQWGEHLACSELNRRGFFATPFAGNIPEIDILCCDENLKTIPIQVKALTTDHLPGIATRYMDVVFDGERQIVKPKKRIANPGLIYLFIKIGREYGKDEFYLIRKKELFKIVYHDYKKWLEGHNNLRPRKPQSLHCSIWLKHLTRYKDNWQILKRRNEK